MTDSVICSLEFITLSIDVLKIRLYVYFHCPRIGPLVYIEIFGNINSNSIEPVTHRDTLIIYNSLFANSELELIPQDV